MIRDGLSCCKALGTWDLRFGIDVLLFLEFFDVSAQIQAFVTVVLQLMLVGSEWTRMIHERILNDDRACCLYRDLSLTLRSQVYTIFGGDWLWLRSQLTHFRDRSGDCQVINLVCGDAYGQLR